MTTTEKAIIEAVAELGTILIRIGDTQLEMAKFISQKLPNLSETERQVLLNPIQTLRQQLQTYQEKLSRLKAAL